MKKQLLLLLVICSSPLMAMGTKTKTSQPSQKITQEQEALIVKSLGELDSSMHRFNIHACLISERIKAGMPMNEKWHMQLQCRIGDIERAQSRYLNTVALIDFNMTDHSLVADIVEDLDSMNDTLVEELIKLMANKPK